MSLEEGPTHSHEQASHDDRTPLDRTIDTIGMGSYQWVLLSLCGFGWLADNMWLQTVAIILPRVQRHFEISDSQIGLLSSSMFAGMMCGAIFWGTCSDIMGRIAVFNGTLFFTALFAMLASFSQSFTSLCFTMFLLGSAVGGSMPTDGTLLLEHMPHDQQHLVTALSLFFSVGAVIAAVTAGFVVPNNSCGPVSSGACDVHLENKGWQYLLQILAAFTLFMFLCRIAFFRIHESPRYLVHAGRLEDAIISLQKISKFNGKEVELEVADVMDDSRENPPHEPSERNSGEAQKDLQASLIRASNDQITDRDLDFANEPLIASDQRLPQEVQQRHVRPFAWLPTFVRRPLYAWLDKLQTVLAPDWRGTTLLVWATWWTLSLAYTMFNVYLPKLLEAKQLNDNTEHTLQSTLSDIITFTLGGCPGALIGAWLQYRGLRQKLTLGLSTVATALLCWIFVLVTSHMALRLTTVGISLSATTMWALLYGWTPAIFATEVRGTACGAASALSRIGGFMAPILGGWLLIVNAALPVYMSMAVFLLGAFCVSRLLVHERTLLERQTNWRIDLE